MPTFNFSIDGAGQGRVVSDYVGLAGIFWDIADEATLTTHVFGPDDITALRPGVTYLPGPVHMLVSDESTFVYELELASWDANNTYAMVDVTEEYFGTPPVTPPADPDTRLYIRHRDRMVQESVQEDLVNTLIAFRWIPGITTRPVISPYNVAAGKVIVHTLESQVLAIVGQNPIQLIDYFPEATNDESGLAGEPETGQTPLNTIALDEGQPGDPISLELGSTLVEIPYRFTFAFWAASNGVAQALLNDLRDRYRGLMVANDTIALYDYVTDPSTPVLAMGVESFQYLRAAEEEAAPHEATMYYAQLEITDEVD